MEHSQHSKTRMLHKLFNTVAKYQTGEVDSALTGRVWSQPPPSDIHCYTLRRVSSCEPWSTVATGICITYRCVYHLRVFVSPTGVCITYTCLYHLQVFVSPTGVCITYRCLYHRLIWVSRALPQLTDVTLSSGWMSTLQTVWRACCHSVTQFSHRLDFSSMMYAGRTQRSISTGYLSAALRLHHASGADKFHFHFSLTVNFCSVQLRQSGALQNSYVGLLYIWRTVAVLDQF